MSAPAPQTPTEPEGGGPDEPPEGAPRARLTMGRAVAIYGGMVVISWLLTELIWDRDPLTAPEVEGVSLWWKLGLGAGVGVVVLIVDALLERLFELFKQMSRAFAQLLGRITPAEAVVYAAFSAVGEEILFRGTLQVWLGLIPASILFGLLHIAPDRRLWMWPVLACAMGFAFGYLFEYTGDVLAPILAHFTINYFGFMRLSREHERMSAG